MIILFYIYYIRCMIYTIRCLLFYAFILMYDILCLYCTWPVFHRQNLFSTETWQVVLIAWETLWQMSLQEHLGEPIYGKSTAARCRCGWWNMTSRWHEQWLMMVNDGYWYVNDGYVSQRCTVCFTSTLPKVPKIPGGCWSIRREVLVGQCHGWSEGLPLDMATDSGHRSGQIQGIKSHGVVQSSCRFPRFFRVTIWLWLTSPWKIQPCYFQNGMAHLFRLGPWLNHGEMVPACRSTSNAGTPFCNSGTVLWDGSSKRHLVWTFMQN